MQFPISGNKDIFYPPVIGKVPSYAFRETKEGQSILLVLMPK